MTTTDRAAKLSVEDRLDIQELFARYAWALNTGDANGVVACFAEDGYLEHLPEGRFVGPNVCVRRDGDWLFESVTVEKWLGDGVPWVGDPRARSAAR